jgi:hypothetical protein
MDSATPAQLPLSEKSKGKRRAIEPNENEALKQNGRPPSPSVVASRSGRPNSSIRTFTVRFSEGVPDLQMTIGPNDTVREVQRRVSAQTLMTHIFILPMLGTMS